MIAEPKFEEVRGASASGFEAISKLHKQLLNKIKGKFEDLHRPVSQGFDMSKLDELKEKSNKAFFADMTKIKTGKSQNIKNQTESVTENDIFGISTPSKPVIKQDHSSDLLELENEMAGFRVSNEPKNDKGLSNDFLDFDFAKPVTQKTQNDSKQNNLDDFDLMNLMTANKTTTMPVSDDYVMFSKTVKPNSQSSFDLSTSNLVPDFPKAKAETSKNQTADPFNFIVF